MLKAKILERENNASILYANIGDPNKYDFAPPKTLIEALQEAIKDPYKSGYSDSQGILPLREAISEHEKNKGINTHTPENILVTSGVSEGISMLMGCIEPNDEILLPGPHYPTYEGYANFTGVKPIDYHCIEDEGWQPDIDDIRKKITDKTAGIVLINPNNPTGAIYSESTVKSLLDLAGEHEIPVISDEIYDKLTFTGKPITPTAKLAKDVPVLTFNGISKTMITPGWRIGWAMMHDPTNIAQELWSSLNKASRIRLCSSTPLQEAVAKILNKNETWDHLSQTLGKLRKRRDVLDEAIKEIDEMSLTLPQGAFYAFPKIVKGKYFKKDWDFALDFLREEHVLFVPGSGFGKEYGVSHFRIVFLAQEDKLFNAMEKLKKFLKK